MSLQHCLDYNRTKYEYTVELVIRHSVFEFTGAKEVEYGSRIAYGYSVNGHHDHTLLFRQIFRITFCGSTYPENAHTLPDILPHE